LRRKREKIRRLPKHRRIIRIPKEYLEVVSIGRTLFSPLYQFENGLRLVVESHLSACYGPDWWETSLKSRLPNVHEYAQSQASKASSMPWVGASARTKVLPIHQVTHSHLEKIINVYQSECIPELFPNMHFFLGHMDGIKRVRNLYSHMFPCLTDDDSRLARREILTLAQHLNSKLSS